MSCLTTKDNTKRTRSPSKIWNAVTTRSLSKTWNTAWNSFPVLEFDQRTYEKPKKSAKKKVQDFCNDVDISITLHQSDISLQKFQIIIEFGGRCAVSAQKNLQWLSYANEWQYELPESLFCSKSLNELDLLGCKFLEDGIRTTYIGSCLRKLKLVHVRVDQLSLQSFLSGCRSLEQVCIQQCSVFEILKIAGVKLEKVNLVLDGNRIQTITIEAPNLQRLCCGGGWDNIKNSLLSSDCKNLKKLIVHNTTVPSDIFQIISLKFQLIENGELKRCFWSETSKMITSADLPKSPLIENVRCCRWETSEETDSVYRW